MKAIDCGIEAPVFRDALRSALAIKPSRAFDNNIIAGIERAPDWVELLTAQLRIAAPAAACGAVCMLLFIQVALQNPSSPKFNGPAPAETVDIDKLMALLDKQDQTIASMTLIEQCTYPLPSNVAKAERPPLATVWTSAVNLLS